MYSKMVARQLEEATEVASAVTKNGDKVAAALAEKSANSSPVDWKVVLEDLAQSLLGTSGKLGELEVEHQIQLLLEKQTRERRDHAVEKVRNRLRGARFLLDQAFGKKKAKGLFPERAEIAQLLPRNLAPLARSIAQVLRGAEIEWPPLDDELHVPKPQELAASLESAAGELEATITAFVPERAGSAFSRGSKKAEYEATRKAVTNTTMILTGLFRAAGFEYAARRLRPGRKRRKVEAASSPSLSSSEVGS